MKNLLHHVAENVRSRAYLQMSLEQESIQLNYGTKFLPEDLANFVRVATANGVNSMGTGPYFADAPPPHHSRSRRTASSPSCGSGFDRRSYHSHTAPASSLRRTEAGPLRLKTVCNKKARTELSNMSCGPSRSLGAPHFTTKATMMGCCMMTGAAQSKIPMLGPTMYSEMHRRCYVCAKARVSPHHCQLPHPERERA